MIAYSPEAHIWNFLKYKFLKPISNRDWVIKAILKNAKGLQQHIQNFVGEVTDFIEAKRQW